MTKLPDECPPPGPPVTLEDSEAVLAEFLGHCRTMVNACVREAWDKPAGMDIRITYTTAAARLMKTSLDVMARLEGDRKEFTHRIVVERGDTPAKISKTSHGS
jgi:hypothetical protein